MKNSVQRAESYRGHNQPCQRTSGINTWHLLWSICKLFQQMSDHQSIRHGTHVWFSTCALSLIHLFDGAWKPLTARDHPAVVSTRVYRKLTNSHVKTSTGIISAVFFNKASRRKMFVFSFCPTLILFVYLSGLDEYVFMKGCAVMRFDH